MVLNLQNSSQGTLRPARLARGLSAPERFPSAGPRKMVVEPPLRKINMKVSWDG